MNETTAARRSGRTEILPDLPSELDSGIAHRAAIGLIVLASDQTIEHEFHRAIRQDGVAAYANRIAFDNHVTPETLRASGARIAEAAALLLPGMPLDVIAYGCTSASMELGEERVFSEIGKARPEAKCTTPVTAALAALRALEVRRVGIVTPYGPDINRNVAAYFAERGFDVPAIASFNRQDDREAARIAPRAIADGIARMGERADVDAVFLSCTNLRFVDSAAKIEAQIGKPVTSSNHALIWHCLRLAGIDAPIDGLGRLFRLGLPG